MNTVHTHGPRIRGTSQNVTTGSRRPHHQNRQWTASDGNRGGTNTTNHADGERWERGGGRGGRGRGRGRGLRKFPNQSLRNTIPRTIVAPVQEVNAYPEVDEEDSASYAQEDTSDENDTSDMDYSTQAQEIYGQDDTNFEFPEIHEPELTTQEERERFYQELVKAREGERKRAIAEGKMDDPLVPKRLEDAITMVGTCMDMCPRFERYRRERENNLTEWELIPGTKRVEHTRAVKMYERAAGDKTLPSDLRPPKVLKRTLDYLFHDLLPRGGFSATYTFIRDRSRAVRNDFTMQHESGPLAIECHDRCARFHILALHFEKDRPNFSVALEEQQLMNTLQSLKEFYEEQRGRYESPTELEMRVYHRLIHIRDQKERHEEIPAHITEHPVFKLTTEFRLHVQAKSAPISKTSALVVDAHGMEIFGKLANVLKEQGSIVMIYLVACILERLFGKDTIDNIEAIRGDLSIPDIIDGKAVYESVNAETYYDHQDTETEIDENEVQEFEVGDENQFEPIVAPQVNPPPTSAFSIPSKQPSVPQTSQLPPPLAVKDSVFASLKTTPTNIFGTFPMNSSSNPGSVFGTSPFVSTPSVPAPSASASTTNYSAGKPSEAPLSRFKSLSDAPVLSDSIPDKQEHTATAPSIFGIPSSSSSPFTTNVSEPNGTPFFAALPAVSSSKPLLQPESNGKIPSFFGSPPKPSGPLNLAAPVFNPSVISHTPPQNSVFSNSTTTTTTTTVPPPSQTSVFGDLSKQSTPTPPIKRHSATPPLKIDTNWQPPNPAPFSPVARALDSPIAPPPMKKPAPISLPSTPTANASAVGSNPFFAQMRGEGLLGSPGGPQSPGSGILSPLDMQSPRIASTSGWANNPTPRQPLLKSISSFALDDKIRGKEKEKVMELSTSKSSSAPASISDFFGSTAASTSSIPTSTSTSTLFKTSPSKPAKPKYDFDAPSKEEMVTMVKEFEENTVMKRCWMCWKKRFASVKEWLEAVEHSDAYRVKKEMSSSLPPSKSKFSQSQGFSSSSGPLALAQRGRHKLSMSVGELESDRSWSGSREGSPSLSVTSSRGKKRFRKRNLEYYEPRTDEEIARRLKENREQNEKRWAQGSYLKVIRSYVQNKIGSLSHSQSFSHSLSHETQTRRHNRSWNIWLSLNPDNDSTAIWLERKFDMPESGKWSSETVFSIPLYQEDLKDGDNKYVDWNPGLIVFECTPMDGIDDEIERKYRVLDDCSRLRDLLDGLSPKRHHIPSLLVLNWAGGEHAEPSVDLVQLIQKYMDDSTIASFMSLGITTTANLDDDLETVLRRLKLDVEGKLVKSTTVRGMFKTFEEEFSVFLLEWFDNCSINGQFDWYLYGHLIQATIGLLNKMASLVSAMLSKPKREVVPTLDITDMHDSDSAYDTVITWLSWVADDDDTKRIITDLQSHININTAFPARTFIEHLLELTVIRTEKHVSVPSHEKLYIPHIDLKASSELFESAIQPYQTSLGQSLNKSLRGRGKERGRGRSPKRRGISEETDNQDLMSPEAKRLKLEHTPSLTASIVDTTPRTSPLMNGIGSDSTFGSGTLFGNGSAHSRSPSIVSLEHMETPDISQIFEGSNGVDVPIAPTRTAPAPSTPTPTRSHGSGPVTIEMLRALARDVKKKYASPTKGLPSS